MNTIIGALFDGYAARDIDVKTMFICLIFTAIIAIYACVVYGMVNKNSFYDRSFHLSLFSLSIITAMVILTIQSNIVVSLGMVGALSIVRFRTAIKSPADLVFLFWSIAIGIICGAGYAMIAIIGSIALTIGIIVFNVLPGEKDSLILVVNAAADKEEEICKLVESSSKAFRVRARNYTKTSLNMAVEVKTDAPMDLVKAVNAMDGVMSASLVEHDGDVTA